MGFLSTLLGGGDAIKSIGDTVYDYKEAQLESQADLGQIQIDTVEAASASLFVSGWRPAIGWVGATALAYKFILYPTLCWIIAIYPSVHLPPSPNAEGLYPIILGMLGLGAMRSYDKVKGTDTK